MPFKTLLLPLTAALAVPMLWVGMQLAASSGGIAAFQACIQRCPTASALRCQSTGMVGAGRVRAGRCLWLLAVGRA